MSDFYIDLHEYYDALENHLATSIHLETADGRIHQYLGSHESLSTYLYLFSIWKFESSKIN